MFIFITWSDMHLGRLMIDIQYDNITSLDTILLRKLSPDCLFRKQILAKFRACDWTNAFWCFDAIYWIQNSNHNSIQYMPLSLTPEEFAGQLLIFTSTRLDEYHDFTQITKATTTSLWCELSPTSKLTLNLIQRISKRTVRKKNRLCHHRRRFHRS